MQEIILLPGKSSLEVKIEANEVVSTEMKIDDAIVFEGGVYALLNVERDSTLQIRVTPRFSLRPWACSLMCNGKYLTLNQKVGQRQSFSAEFNLVFMKIKRL
ncbi:MAG: hypothetical protein Q8P32_00170 [Candidatus Komeilibacteria bacterium]|nr:hypothetical protein [Candidatus Komeilibacteria bacterium]